MRQIRRGVFETNSSSTHSITVCTKKEFEAFEDGELMLDMADEKLVEMDRSEIAKYPYRYIDCDSFFTPWKDHDRDYRCMYETYEKEIKTPKGDRMVVFGEYGHD